MGKVTKQWGYLFYGAIIVAFLFPFVGISCEGLPVVNFSGFDLVAGCNPGDLGGMGDMGSGEGSDAMEKQMDIDPEPFAIGALLLALIGLGLAYVRKEHKSTMLGNIGISVLGTVCLIMLAVKAFGQEEELTKMADPTGGGGSGELDIDVKLEVGLELGFYIAALGFLLVIIGSAIAHSQWSQIEAEEAAAGSSPPGPAPTGGGAPLDPPPPEAAPPGAPPPEAPPGPPPE